MLRLPWLLRMSAIVVVCSASGPPKKPCCAKLQQWEALGSGELSSHIMPVPVYDMAMMLALDFAHLNKSARNIVAYTPNSPAAVSNTTQFVDFNKRLVWDVDWKAKTCQQQQLPPDIKPQVCVPEGSVYAGTPRFGFGHNTLNTDRYVTPKKRESFATGLVTNDTCLPVALYSRITLPLVVEIVIIDQVTQGIKDPSVFNLPPFCNHTSVQTVTYSALPFLYKFPYNGYDSIWMNKFNQDRF